MCCPHLWLRPQDPLRRPPQLQDVGCNGASAPARWSESGRMADSAPNTGYEFKLANFFSYTDPEHTPINVPDSHHNFLCPDDAAVIPPVQKNVQDLLADGQTLFARRFNSPLDVEQKSNSFQYHQKEVECISAQKSFLENSLRTP